MLSRRSPLKACGDDERCLAGARIKTVFFTHAPARYVPSSPHAFSGDLLLKNINATMPY